MSHPWCGRRHAIVPARGPRDDQRGRADRPRPRRRTRNPPTTTVAGMKTARTGGVVRAGAVMAVATLVSRGTGFLAKVVIVSVLGFGVVNDAYTIANTLPNIVFELLIGGVLTSVAIPLLSRARADPDGGVGYTQRLMTAAVVGLLGATALAIACAPLLTNLYLVRRLRHRRPGPRERARLPAVAADLLLRHRRALRRDPQHGGEVRRTRLGAGGEQPRGDRRRHRAAPDARIRRGGVR